MARKYLGEELVTSLEGTPYENYTPVEWAMCYIGSYGQIDGSHHKQWVLDQVARILKGTPIILKLAKWDDGFTEYRFTTGKPSVEYLEWVQEMRGCDESGEDEYSYDEGGAP